MRPRETPNLERWREASRHAVKASLDTADVFTEYLVAGGPDAIKSLNQTIRKLQLQLEEQKSDGRLERYRKLQKDLEECDKVRETLRSALLSCQWTDDEVDAYLDKRLFKANTLYGASRELLLRENRILRAQLESHLVTTRTSRVAAPAEPGRAKVPESKLKQARMMQGPHMEYVARLVDAAEQLDAAERGYKLPSVAHAEVQADDGSRKYISTLEQQLATLAGQKLQLMQQVAAMTEQNRVLDMKLEGALDQVAELRRQKTEMLAHQENLSKDLREHLLSEAKRADNAETLLAEAKLAAAASKEAEEAARAQMERALAEAQALHAALQEKSEQVDTLRGLYMELREALEKLAGDVTSGQQETARRLLEATREQFEDHRALLGDVKAAVVDTYRAAQHNSDVVTELTSQQRMLVTEVVKTSTLTLNTYERQLAATQQLLLQSEADRARLTRQAIAASALSRIEDRRHERAVQRLLEEVPAAIKQQLEPRLQALEEGTLMVAEEVVRTKDTLAAGGAAAGSRSGMLHPPMAPDVVDDATTQLLGDSKLLRAQLLGLYGAGPAAVTDGPPPGFVPPPPSPPFMVLHPPTDPCSIVWTPGLEAAAAMQPFPPGYIPPEGGAGPEPVWMHPLAPAFVAAQPGGVGPDGALLQGSYLGPMVAQPPGRLDLVLYLPPQPEGQRTAAQQAAASAPSRTPSLRPPQARQDTTAHPDQGGAPLASQTAPARKALPQVPPPQPVQAWGATQLLPAAQTAQPPQPSQPEPQPQPARPIPTPQLSRQPSQSAPPAQPSQPTQPAQLSAHPSAPLEVGPVGSKPMASVSNDPDAPASGTISDAPRVPSAQQQDVASGDADEVPDRGSQQPLRSAMPSAQGGPGEAPAAEPHGEGQGGGREDPPPTGRPDAAALKPVEVAGKGDGLPDRGSQPPPPLDIAAEGVGPGEIPAATTGAHDERAAAEGITLPGHGALDAFEGTDGDQGAAGSQTGGKAVQDVDVPLGVALTRWTPSRALLEAFKEEA